MNEPKRIPIRDAKTGEVRYSEPVGQHAPRSPETNPGRPPVPASGESLSSGPGERADSSLKDSPNQDVAHLSDSGTPDERQAEAPTSQVAARPKPEIETFAQFLVYAYSRRGQRVALKDKVERAIAQDPRISPEDMGRIAAHVREDVVFAVPRQLLLTARTVHGYPGLRGAVRSFVRDVMLGHPLFQSPKVDAAVRNLEESPRPEDVLRLLSDFDRKSLPPSLSDALKSSSFDELRLNAVNCLAVWIADVKGLPAAAVADALFLAVWRPRASTLEQETSKLRAITEVDQLAGVGFICEEFRRQAVDRHAQAEAALRDAAAVRERLAASARELAEVRAQLQEREVAATESAAQNAAALASLRAAGETEATHLRDDKETFRTRVLRRLKADVDLLELGLQALRRPEPKVHVMMDSAERVADALRAEIKNLQGEH
jgi:hypothetical protein